MALELPKEEDERYDEPNPLEVVGFLALVFIAGWVLWIVISGMFINPISKYRELQFDNMELRQENSMLEGQLRLEQQENARLRSAIFKTPGIQ